MPTTGRLQAKDTGLDRRQEIARATWRVIARQGLDRTSMREIAQELGMTTGLLTHRFRSRDDLLAFVFEGVVEILEEGGYFTVWSDLEGFKAMLLSLLPGGEEQVEWWKVWVSFVAGAYSRPEQRQRHEAIYVRTAAAWTRTFETLRDKGALRADIQPALEAESLGFLLDGMGTNALFAPSVDAARQKAILDNHFAKLLP